MLPFAVYLTHKEQLLYSHVNRLEDISERTTTESVSAIAWIPSNDIRFATITIPKLAHSLRAQAVIFELEERLLMDAAELHFAIVNSTEAAENTGEEVVQVACLPKVRIAHLLTQTKQHNITLKAAYPNIFLLPWEESDRPMARIFMSDDLIIVRTGICEGFSGDLSLIPYISHQLLQGDANEAEQLQVELYVEHGTEIPSALAHYQAHTISLHKLIQLATPHPLNLLQGEFEPISPWLLGIKIAMPVIKPIALVCLLLGLSTSLSYAKKYLDTKAIEADILQQLQQQTPEARGQWQDYFKQQLRYYQNAQRDTLPWRSFQNLLPLLQSCKACKITSLTVDQNGVHISLLSNTQQDKFARQSSDALRIESTKDKAGNHSYQLRWDAQ